MRPKNRYELFNLRHAQLRNAIERAFGQLKIRFRVLRLLVGGDVNERSEQVIACAMLHNFFMDEKDGVTPEERKEWADQMTADGFFFFSYFSSFFSQMLKRALLRGGCRFYLLLHNKRT